ncbi:unnamed protein product, partial [Polarella glacialis]
RASSRWDWALVLLQRLQQGGAAGESPPDAISFNSAMAACERAAEWGAALQLLAETPWPDLVAHNISISACEKGSQWRLSLQLLSSLRGRLLAPDLVSYNATISGCERARRWERAAVLLQEMQQRKVAPSVVTLNSAISSCADGEEASIGSWLPSMLALFWLAGMFAQFNRTQPPATQRFWLCRPGGSGLASLSYCLRCRLGAWHLIPSASLLPYARVSRRLAACRLA